MIDKSCENCANAPTCKKAIGYMFGFCNTDFEPKRESEKGSGKHE